MENLIDWIWGKTIKDDTYVSGLNSQEGGGAIC